MGTCSIHTCTIEEFPTCAAPTEDTDECNRKNSSESLISSLTTMSQFSLFENQKPPEYYRTIISNDGKIGAVREFITHVESAAICWVAFTGDHRALYIDNDQLFSFFEFCLLYVSQTVDPALRCAFLGWRLHEMYQEFVIRIFGKAKVRLNQREFWCVADSIQSRFETEKEPSESDEHVDIGHWRKQRLIKVFYLGADEQKMNLVLFKLFSSNGNILTKEEFYEVVFHSIVFFSQKEESELERSGDLWAVIDEVVIDVLKGQQPMEMSFDRFCIAAAELRSLFHDLIEIWKIRAERSQDERSDSAASCKWSSSQESEILPFKHLHEERI